MKRGLTALPIIAVLVGFVAAPSVAAAPRPRPLVVAIGDSMTTGVLLPGAVPSHTVPLTAAGCPTLDSPLAWPELLQRLGDWRVSNEAIGGARLTGSTSTPCEWPSTLSRLSGLVSQRPAALVMLQGINDLDSGVPVKGVEAAIGKVRKAFQQVRTTVVLVTLTPLKGKQKLNAEIRSVNQWIMRTTPFNDRIDYWHYLTINGAINSSRFLRGAVDLDHPNQESERWLAGQVRIALRANGI